VANEFKVEGIEDLMARINSLGERVATRTVNKALREGAEVLREGISQRAPRSKSNTDHLADNIVMSGVKQAEVGKYIEVGPDKKHFYGRFHELGTTKMPAHPFVGPALEEDGKAVMDTMAGVLREELAKKR
jgi:HK97 gp10 family phage protein